MWATTLMGYPQEPCLAGYLQEPCLAWEATAGFRHVCEKSPWAAGCPPPHGRGFQAA